MAAAGTPALLVSDPGNLGWLTGFSGSFGRALVTARDAVFITDSRYQIQARAEVAGFELRTYAAPVETDTFVAEQIRALGLGAIAFESANTTYAAWETLAHKLSGIALLPAKDFFADLRMVKSAEEIQKVRKACQLADAGFAHILRMVQPGVSEYDLCLDLEFFIRRQGAELAFPIIAVSGENSAKPHGKPGERKLEVGDFVTFDFGARIEGYNSDITRTVVVGEPTDRHREIYDQVLKAQLACLEAMRPGVAARDVDALARKVLDEKGLAKYFGHGLGHGLGRAVHDFGRMNATSEHVLAPGQIWTVEPGVYVEGFGGVRIEDDVVVTESGIEILTQSTKELLALPRP
jgi:Xaa-Pro aminopeptidase